MGDADYDYDFSFSDEYSTSPPPYNPRDAHSDNVYRTTGKPTPEYSPAAQTRKSATERAEEILRQNKSKTKPSIAPPEPEESNFASIASSWDNIMKDFKIDDYDDNVETASVGAKKEEPEDFNHTITSMSEDSFELTSADFEVGTIANRRTQEKHQVRSSTAGLPSTSVPLKVVSSPDVSRVCTTT
jgi:hypothetical protein